MVKVEVIKNFTLARFREIANLERKGREVHGKLFTGDIFECSKDLADYLTGNNMYKEAFVKIIEVAKKEPTKEAKIIEEVIKEEKPKKSNKKKTK